MRVTIDLHSREFVTATIFIAALIALLAWVVPAWAHSDGHQLYDADCCNMVDCAPVEKVEIIETQKFVAAGLGFSGKLKMPSQMVVTTRHGTVVVPEDFTGKARRQSRDNRMHACIRQSCSAVGCVKQLICLYEPPGI